MQINQQTQLNMVIGYPLKHTQSPLLHNTLYQHLSINAVLIACAHEEINALMQAIKTLHVGLTAVTVPFKEKVLAYLDELSPEVQAMQAANTIIQRQGKLFGHNTDIAGIAYALRDIRLKDKKVLILGAGGAARALGYFLQQQYAHLFWFNRTRSKAENLAIQFSGELISREKISSIHFDLIINTTPLGMFPNQETPLAHYPFQPQQTIFDLVYNPIHTPLLQDAEHQGARIISGLDMFIGQGVKQIELWLGKPLNSKNLISELKSLLVNNQETFHNESQD
jgi:shikimate dehydrogenase